MGMKGKKAKAGPVSYRPFRITGHGVLFNGEAKSLKLGAGGKPTSPQPARVRGEVRSPGVIGGIPEAS
jgi:hypothetical protein